MGKTEEKYFCILILQSTTKIYGHYIENKHKKTLQVEEECRIAKDFRIEEDDFNGNHSSFQKTERTQIEWKKNFIDANSKRIQMLKLSGKDFKEATIKLFQWEITSMLKQVKKKILSREIESLSK